MKQIKTGTEHFDHLASVMVNILILFYSSGDSEKIFLFVIKTRQLSATEHPPKLSVA